MVWQKSWWSLEEGRGAELAAIERDRDPATDPGRPAVVPGPRSGSIDPGSWNAASTPFPATMLHCFFHRPELKMATLPAMPEGATALEIPSDRPAFYNSFKCASVPTAATAVRLVTPPSERRTTRPQSISVYMPPPPPMEHFDTLEEAMRDQPAGTIVTFMGGGASATSNRFHIEFNYMAHVALRDYPAEQRTEEHLAMNCNQFGFLREVDPACFAAPDLATVHVVLQQVHPREIPHQIRIGYYDGSKSVVPVEVVAVWDRAHSYDADGQYVRLFVPAPAAAA